MERKLTPEAIKFLSERVANDGRYLHAKKINDPRSGLVALAGTCVGIREKGGNNKGPEVKEFQKTVDGRASSEAWCMAFVETMIAFIEYDFKVKSPIFASEHCMTVWGKTPKAQRVKMSPLPGAIVIWQKGNSSSGHTGIVEGADEKNFTAYEGNTESGVNTKGKVERDGGGVYHTKRSRKGSGSMKVVGFLKPF